jgi:hypothetical protein
MDDFWSSSDYFTGPPLTDKMMREAEQSLDYKLPESYIKLVRLRNDGTPKRCCFPVRGRKSWQSGYLELSSIRGIGGYCGIDSPHVGSQAAIRGWR